MVMLLKRLIRPLIPDGVMVRFRLHQHSRTARWNVDVFLPDRKAARRWLATTPDTYRVRLDAPPPTSPTGFVVVSDPDLNVPDELGKRAVSLLGDPWLGAVVVGETDPPRIVDRRRVEPKIGPRLIVVRDGVLDEVGGVPEGPHPLPGLLARIRDAGHPIGLVPLPRSDAPTERSDPIHAPSVVILAAVPMHDVGGGARSTQLAIEFVRQGHHTTLVSLYSAQESVDLGLRFVDPKLEQYQLRWFDAAAYASRVAEPGLVLVEAPARTLAETAYALQEAGWHLIYDIIDDWSDPALGGDWFHPGVEEELIAMADRVVASAPDLVARSESMGKSADLVPNAVNAEIFGADLPPRPADLPVGHTIIGYHGSLYGDWFDWDGLKAVAEEFPEAAVVIIGDDKARRPPMPPNVHFLGLKAQADLPAYLQRFDVGIIPFKLNDTTHAVSPLKVYEYLASGVRVAAPPLRPLGALDGVHLDAALTEAVRLALDDEAPNRVSALREHSWATRVETIIAQRGEATTNPVAVVRRPASHWQRSQREVLPAG